MTRFGSGKPLFLQKAFSSDRPIWTLLPVLISLSSSATGVHLQVFGHQSCGDRVHGGPVSREDSKRFVSVLAEVENLPGEQKELWVKRSGSSRTA